MKMLGRSLTNESADVYIPIKFGREMLVYIIQQKNNTFKLLAFLYL